LNKRKVIRLKDSLKTIQLIRLKDSLKVVQKPKIGIYLEDRKREETKDYNSLKAAKRPAQLIKGSISRSVISD
jgi:hypothetical protein